MGMGNLVGETGVCARGVPLHLGGVTTCLDVMQMGCRGVTGLLSRWGVGLGLTKGDGTFIGWKLVRVGTGPIDSLMSVTQLNCVCSCGTWLMGVLAVVDGAWSCTLPLIELELA